MSKNGVKKYWIPARRCGRCKRGKYVARADGTDYYDCGHFGPKRDVSVSETKARKYRIRQVNLSTTIVNCRFEDYDIYVGRPSIWGNPFSHVKSRHASYEVDDRAEAIRRYAEYLRSETVLMDNLVNLEGKVLGCWCRPHGGFAGRLMCHAQIIVGLIHDVDPLEVP